MCTGKCAKFIGVSLYPLCLISIVCNVIQFFPGWETEPVKNPGEQMTPEVIYLGGLIGGGLMMFLSIIFAAIGAVGSLYGFAVSTVGMVKGPQCLYSLNLSISDSKWEDNYLFKREMWKYCIYPKDVVEFNVILFSMVIASTGISLILCTIQMLNGLFGCLCGTCRNKE
ncbi:hypothetical protein GDO78_022911 [Eleutherodactylus coqui]|uniref:Uncharacterized protein n=1 Tax=Eleutherodactylus coqui TaxID=57060 RepID=A0A8J6E9E0_ELECQ|nr:hypothetical protein GDO78_022911 [Eleutherodactylus coqui]